MTILPQLRAEVVAAAAAPRRRARVPRGPAIATAALAVAAVAIVLLALPGRQSPTAPDASRPPAAQLERFGILRREQTTGDLQALGTLLSGSAPDDIRGVRRDYVRDAGHGLILYSLPLARPPLDVLTAGRPENPLCLSAAGAIGCWNDDQLAAGASLTAGNRRVGLVPDGVARVTLRLDDGRSYSGDVHDNVFDIEVGRPRGAAPGVRSVIWRDARGRVAGP